MPTHFNALRTMAGFALAVLVVVSGAGCQQTVSTDYHKLDIADVSGTILLEGEPLANAYVKFEGDDLTYSFGKTDNSGHYMLYFNTERAGIMPGKKKVLIRLSGPFGSEGAMLDGADMGDVEASGDSEGDGDGDEAPAKPAKSVPNELPETYNAKSQLEADVVSGSQEISFDLRADGSTKAPQ